MTVSPRTRLLALTWLLLAAAPSTASAQIFSWRDADGNLVLSNVRREDGSAVKPTAATTSPAAVPSGSHDGADDSRLYDTLITTHARANGLRSGLVRAVVAVESGFNPYARSPKGALGLMQLMPATIERFGVVNPFDPAANVRAGTQYLRELLDRYDNDETLALAAYNAGPGAVDRHGQQVPPYAETRDYVARVGRIATGAGSDGGPDAARVPSTRIERSTEVVDGQEVVRLSNRRDAAPVRRVGPSTESDPSSVP